MAVSITNSKISALNSVLAMTVAAATSTAAGGPETFTYTPTAGCQKTALIFNNTGSTSIINYSIAAGSLGWASKAITGSIGASAIDALEIDNARVLSTSGTVQITFTPSTGASSTTALLSNAAFKMYALELL